MASLLVDRSLQHLVSSMDHLMAQRLDWSRASQKENSMVSSMEKQTARHSEKHWEINLAEPTERSTD